MQLVRNSSFLLGIILLFACSNPSRSQDLERKIFLGIRMTPLNSTIKKQKNYTDNHGVFIAAINPNGTLGKLGVPKGSILKSINAEKITAPKDIQTILSSLKEGDEISVSFFYEGSVQLCNGSALGRPKEVHPKAEVHYESVVYKDNQLRSILYTPKGVEKAPVIFYIQGYTCQSIEYSNSNPIKRIFNDWIDAGFAVYLVEKPGMGDSKSKIKCADITFDQELEGFKQAYKNLWKSNKIDIDNIFLYGHSMGGVVAPILAIEKAPKGVMVFGTVGKNWHEYMKDVMTEQQVILGVDKATIARNKKQNLPFIKDLIVLKKSNLEMVKNPVYSNYLKSENLLEELKRGYYTSRHYTYWASLGDVNIPNIWSKVTTDVYVMHGELDVQTINYKYAKMIADTINQNKGTAKFDIIPKTDHVFLKFNSMEENVKALSNGSYRSALRTKYNPAVATYSINWIKSKSKQL